MYRSTINRGRARPRTSISCLGVLALAGGLVGCGGGYSGDCETNLKALAACYSQFARNHQGVAPAGEEEFRAFIESGMADLPDDVYISDVDSLFVSPRDGEPLQIMYGVVVDKPGPTGLPVVAFEREGQDGKRYVAWMTGEVKELDEEEFNVQVAPALEARVLPVPPTAP